MPNESFRYSKQISDQGRERSVEVRRERAALKERLKAGRSVQSKSSTMRVASQLKSECSRSSRIAPVWGR